jgi:hypothetical protein
MYRFRDLENFRDIFWPCDFWLPSLLLALEIPEIDAGIVTSGFQT